MVVGLMVVGLMVFGLRVMVILWLGFMKRRFLVRLGDVVLFVILQIVFMMVLVDLIIKIEGPIVDKNMLLPTMVALAVLLMELLVILLMLFVLFISLVVSMVQFLINSEQLLACVTVVLTVLSVILFIMGFLMDRILVMILFLKRPITVFTGKRLLGLPLVNGFRNGP
jgi:hypothetical protein